MNKAARIKSFLDFTTENNKISVNQVTPLFEKLLKNVKNEYKKFHNEREPKINNLEVVSESESGNYLQDQNFIESFTRFKEQNELPFSISTEFKSPNPIEGFINFPSQHIFRTSYFVNSSSSRETFFQIQRQHKIWWMKFGSSPGKYSISDQKSEQFFKFVTIRSSVEDKEMDVERLKMFSLKDCIRDKSKLIKFLSKVPNRKREIVPDVIEAVVDLQVASFALLIDAVNSSEHHTALHRRSAPYQLALITKGASKDLSDLARYIELLIEAAEPRIEILNNSKMKIIGDDDLKRQFETFDNIGIPYAIILDESALESGLFKLRNRNTTLAETIHLSDVNNYLIKIFNSV